MGVLTMCAYYYWDNAPKCEKGHKANIKCHNSRKDCPNYFSSQEDIRWRERYGRAVEEI